MSKRLTNSELAELERLMTRGMLPSEVARVMGKDVRQIWQEMPMWLSAKWRM